MYLQRFTYLALIPNGNRTFAFFPCPFTRHSDEYEQAEMINNEQEVEEQEVLRRQEREHENYLLTYTIT